MLRLARTLLAALAVAGTSLNAAAETGTQSASAPFMSEPELSRTFGGKTIEGHYADGVTFAESYGSNGRIDYRERGRDMSGRWLVRGGAFCTLYDTSPTGGCYRVRAKGANCFEFYFVARDDKQIERGPGQPPSWTALAWIKGQRATCHEQPTV